MERAVEGVDGRLECLVCAAELMVECECAEWMSVGEEPAEEKTGEEARGIGCDIWSGRVAGLPGRMVKTRVG